MTSFETAPSYPQSNIAANTDRGFLRSQWLKVGVAISSVALGASACNVAANTSETTLPHVQPGNEQCGATNAADTNSATPNGYFPKLWTNTGSGEMQPMSAVEASKIIRNQLCNDIRVEAVFKTLDSFWQNEQLPTSEGFMNSLQSNYKNYLANPKAAKEDLATLDHWLSMLQPTNKFAVVSGQATVLDAKRNSHNQITEFKLDTINATGLLAGYEIGFNHNSNNYTEIQKEVFQKLQTLILIDVQGNIVFNMLINGQPVELKINKNKVSITPSTYFNQIPSGSQSSAGKGPGEATQGNNGGGVQVGHQGCGVPGLENCGGGSGNNTGNKGPSGTGTGGNQPSGTTTTTFAGTTTTTTTGVPSTTTTTSPIAKETTTTSANQCITNPFDPNCHN